MALRPAIQAPVPRPPRYGLVNAAVVPNSAEVQEGRWVDGWTFQPEACGVGSVATLECGATPGRSENDALAGPSNVEGEPFLVYSWERCSPFGFRSRDWQGRARRQLEAVQSALIANQLWSNALGLTDFVPLNDLTSDRLTTTPASLVAAVGCIEAGLASALKGQRGMIHVPAGLVAHLQNAQLIERDGQQLISPMGHLYVPDAGYDGTGPGGLVSATSTYIYGTSMMAVWLTPVEVLPPTLDQTGANGWVEALDRAVNDVVVWGQRTAGIVWDECAHFAAETNVAPCAIGGAS